MESLLMLVHRIPFPPNKGDKIRSYHLLQQLAQHFKVHLATFVDDADDWQHVPRVQELCASSHFAALKPSRARLRSLGALLGNRSLSLDYYRDAGLARWVAETVQRHGIERALVFSSAMAQYAEAVPGPGRVVDFCDVDSEKWREYAVNKRFPMNLVYAHEARQLLRYERKVAADCGAALFVSPPEAALFARLAPESAARIGHFSNGVDTDYFSPQRGYDNPYPAATEALVFCGAMDYWPNVDAVSWFAHEVFPAIKARRPDAAFYIVGARPSAEVTQLAALPGVHVTGTVPDVRPYVAHAAVCVAPLRVARGIQNKVLEAMSMGKTIVVSPQALEGIDATPGAELLLADGAVAFGAAVGAALDAPAAGLGQAARARVEDSYSWQRNLAPVIALLKAGTPAVAAASQGGAQWTPA